MLFLISISYKIFNELLQQKLSKIFLIIVFIISVFSSCSPTKYLEDNTYLLNKVKIECDNSNFDDYEFESFLKQKPIRKTFKIAMHARIYNMVNPKKEEKRTEKIKRKLDRKNTRIEKKFDDKTEKIQDKKKSYSVAMNRALEREDSVSYEKYKLKYDSYSQNYTDRVKSRTETIKELKKEEVFTFAGWLLEIGEEPEVFDPLLLDKTANQFKFYLQNKGYYNAEIEYVSPRKFKKRVNVYYNIYPNEPVVINKISLNTTDDTLKKIIFDDFTNSELEQGNLLDIDVLQEERTRISDMLRDKGYYNFSKQYIKYTIDTTENKYLADINIDIDQFTDLSGNVSDHIKYKIGDVYIFSDYNPQLALEFPVSYFLNNDTSLYYNEDSIKYYFITKEELIVNPTSIINDIYIFPDSVYSLSNIKATYKHLSSLKIYKLSNIQFEEKDTVNHVLECNIQLTPSDRQSYTAELQGTNTSGNIGATGNLKYQHKNLFKGGEILNLKLSLTLESNKFYNDTTSEGIKFRGFNTQEYSFETGFEFPKLLIPFEIKKFVKRNNPKTTITVGFSYQNRPDYIRTMANAVFTYVWKSSEQLSHNLSPIKISLIRVPAEKMDSAFVAWLLTSYIRESYEDQFIIGSSYSLSFSNQKTAKRDFFYLKLNTGWSGNSLFGILSFTNRVGVTNLKTDREGSFIIPVINTTFAQFLKADLDFRFYNILDENNTLVYRIFCGAGYPLGNSTLLPFSEKYFSGGANNLRAWQVRSLGPGTYKMPSETTIPNQSADIKIEANLEYRVKLFWILEGAFFIDAGNIWSINKYDKREGSQFKLNSFYKQFAVGSGFGARLDVNFFVLRFDIGVKIVDPTLPEKDRWIIYYHPLVSKNNIDNLGFNIGIGYPF